MRIPAIAVVVILGVAWGGRADDRPRYEQRWVYSQANLQVDRNADDLITLVQRAAKAGYNGLVLADYKLNVLDRVPDHYFKNVARVKAAAEAARVEIIPAVFPIGYSSGLLAHDPNLAEGLPVKDAPFVVQGRQANLVPAASTRLVNGGLEEARGDRFAGFSLQDGPGQSTFADRDVTHGGKQSCRMQDVAKGNPSGNCRLAQRVKVRPHAAYRLSCWVKTDGLKPTGGFRLLALGAKAGRSLTFFETGLEATGDWKKLSVVFNSLDESEITAYAGQWGGQSGKLWVDDIHLEELGLMNVLRRPGCPLTVTSGDGRTVYEEGKDFERVKDPKLGQVPYAGEYDFDHAGPTIRLTAASRIKEGDELQVSWFHPVAIHESQVACCLSEPKVLELLRDQARRVNDLLKPKTFFMSHDEIRVAGWCRCCVETKKTPGEMLAQNASRCVAILKEINPQARIVVWSDMFDPHHNAVAKYYLVNGSWEGSWQGLPKEVVIANWNGGKAEASLKFFAERGHPQVIAGYYDGDLKNFEKWDAATKGVPGVTGFTYTTWQRKYDHLEEYGKALLRKE